MLLHIHLLNKVQEKLKQPYNNLNLELSETLSYNNFYSIDKYFKYYLTEINKYEIKKKHIYGIDKIKIFKYI